MTLIYLGCAWLAGVLLGSLLHLPSSFVGLLISLPLASLLLWRKVWPVRLISACFLFFLLGILRFSISAPLQSFGEGHIAHYNDQGWVKIEGIVSGEPDVRDTYTNLRVAVSKIEVDGQKREVTGTVLVRAPRYPEYDYGDELQIEGLLETPPELEDFSYREYLARQGVYSMLRRPQIRLTDRGQGSVFRRTLLAFKRRAQHAIGLILHEPQAALLTGILLGVETGIPADLTEAFSATGTAHIIAISGFNISIIAGLFSGLSIRLLGKRRAMPVALAGIIMYTILVGASAAVVRAAIMGCLYVIAAHYGRQTEALTSLMAAGILMTLLNPQTLWDLGFQLSFAATLGLILYTPVLQSWFEKLLSRMLAAGTAKRAVGVLNEALIVTLAAQITTMPLIVANFRQLSLVTLLSNFAILPAQPAVMLCGGAAAIAGLIWLPLGQALGWIAWLFLTYTIRAVEITARIPYASLNLGHVSAGLVWVYYGLLAWERGWLTSIWVAVVPRQPDGKLHVTFFDVGDGDAIFVWTPRGQKILIDGGPSPTTLIRALSHKVPFWDRIDLVILTHVDMDHIAGLIPVLRRYRVGQVLDSGYKYNSALYEHCLELISNRGIHTCLARAGTRIETGDGLELMVLHPGPEPMEYTNSDVNNNSIVTRLVMGQVSFLFAGDIEEAAEGILVASGQELASTVLKVPHHGSHTSSTMDFLKAVNPELAVISVGADNEFGHPSSQVLDRLEELAGEEHILRTDEHGTIEVVSDGEKTWIGTGPRTSRQWLPRLKSLWRRLTDRLPSKLLIAALAVAAILIWIAVANLPDGKLHVVFFDVGEGDAIFIETPRGQQILVDGGPNPTTLIGDLGRRMPFWDHSLDLVILTHADEDHIAGLIPVLERYRVGQVLDSGYEHNNPTYDHWLELIEEKGISASLARAGTRIATGDGVGLAVLHPGAELMEYTDADSNNNSVVTRLVMGQVSFLLPGDIEEEAEARLVASGQELSSTVLKVPHHGGNTSSSVAFLRAVDPEFAVISVGADNRFGHPSPQTLNRLEELMGEERILRTDKDGSIEVVTDGERIWIETD